jgi:hypothetical protein
MATTIPFGRLGSAGEADLSVIASRRVGQSRATLAIGSFSPSGR